MKKRANHQCASTLSWAARFRICRRGTALWGLWFVSKVFAELHEAKLLEKILSAGALAEVKVEANPLISAKTYEIHYVVTLKKYRISLPDLY